MSSKSIIDPRPADGSAPQPAAESKAKLRRYWPAAAILAGLILIGGVMAYVNGMFGLHVAASPGDDPQALIQAAIEEFERAIELEPGNPEGYEWLSKAYLLADEPEAALAVYQQAIQYNPTQPWPYVGLGRLYQAQGQVDKARAVYEQAAANNPDQAWPQLHLGDLYLTAKADFETAAEFYGAAIAGAPEQPDGYLKLGDLKKQQGDITEALGHYQQAVAAAPLDPRPKIVLGQALLEAGDAIAGRRLLETVAGEQSTSSTVQLQVGWALANTQPDLAQPYFEQALLLDRTNAAAALELARLYRQQQDYDQALRYYRQAETGTTDWEIVGHALYEQGIIFQAQADYDKAEQFFLRALEYIPQNPWLLTTLGEFYYWQQSNEDQALTFLQQAAELPANTTGPHLALGRVLLDMGRIPEAVAALERMQTAQPESAEMLRQVGEVLLRSPETVEVARDYLERAVKLDPANAQSYLLLGHAFLHLRQPEAARQAYAEAIDLSSDKAQSYLAIGEALKGLTAWQDLVQLYQNALAEGISNPDIYRDLADAYLALDETESALKYYQMASQLRPTDQDLRQRIEQLSN